MRGRGAAGGLAAVVLSASIIASPVGAAERFVHRRGDDAGNDCLTASTPCATIGHAIGQAASGDTINVARGTYKESLVIDSSTVLTLLGGWQPTFTTRDPAMYRTSLKAHRDLAPGRSLGVSAGPGEVIDVTLDGFTLRGAALRFYETLTLGGLEATADGGSVTLTVRGTKVERCRVYADGDQAAIDGFARNGGTLNLTLTGVTLQRNRESAIWVFSESGGNAAIAAVNSIVTRTEPLSRLYYTAAPAVLISSSSMASFTFLNSTLADNPFTGLMMTVGGEGSLMATLRNAIVWGNSPDLSAWGTVPEVDHSDIGFVSPGSYNDLGGNLNTDPLLDGFARLEAGSPMIDAGTCSGTPASDVDGDPRPAGSGCDIGADEFVP